MKTDLHEFREIEAGAFRENPFTLIGQQWMLITAGAPDRFNTMTASWGGMGTLWDRNVCFAFVRPSRYTYEFMEKAEGFTLSFFDEAWRDKLLFCGTESGRKVDKARHCGFTPASAPEGGVYFAEARIVILCRKIAFADLDPAHFLDPAIHGFYEGTDHHRMYVGEIRKILSR